MESSEQVDIGDYMKVFACTAVIMQSVLAFVLKMQPSNNVQNVIGIIYNLVKFTAPAFIFGILYTTIRITENSHWSNYGNYLKHQWSALFVPTILWTSLYLLVFPNLQQVTHFHDFSSFIWQFINGNAAPHLWYNTMMLQFILIMPLFWTLHHLFAKSNLGAIAVIIAVVVFFCLWLWMYDANVFHGVHQKNWYLLDRIFLSFIIYAVFGVLAWDYRQAFETFVKKSFWILLLAWIATFIWTNLELFSYKHPLKLTNAPYDKPSMTIYSLLVILLIASLAMRHLKQKSRALPTFHFLAIYAYRAYLSNVFWLELIWLIVGAKLAVQHPLISLFFCYILTWILSFASAYIFHIIWSRAKKVLRFSRT